MEKPDRKDSRAFLLLALVAVAVAVSPANAAGESAPPELTAARTVYLTFDDGPSPRWTPAVLDVLKRHGARATFFVLGSQLRAHPALARRIVAEGHVLANHTYSHVDLTRVDAEHFADEVEQTQALIRKLSGQDERLLRPPYGAANAHVRLLASRLGYRVVLWDVDPQDWRRPGAAAIARRVLAGARPGKVVLLHDGGGDRSQTVAALRTVLATLDARAYSFRSL